VLSVIALEKLKSHSQNLEKENEKQRGWVEKACKGIERGHSGTRPTQCRKAERDTYPGMKKDGQGIWEITAGGGEKKCGRKFSKALKKRVS